jgi:glycerol-3-phosphate dehydrogenase (NAD(P)+)
MPTVIAVLGDGSWGTAIALLLARNPDHRITLWSAREESGRLLRERRENTRLLPGVPIPHSVHLTSDIREALTGADLLISAIPTIFLRETLARIRPIIPFGQPGQPAWPPVVSLTKGLENNTFLRPTQILETVLGATTFVVLSGPSHAEEVSQGLPTSVVAASEDYELARRVQGIFNTDRFRVYTNFDPKGVELAGALKNVIGIAAGISDGLGFGDNAKSALLTRGLAEITRFGIAHGADAATFAGLAGLGDLLTTCVSQHGRNRRVGLRLGKGEKMTAILGDMVMVAEGVNTTRSVHERASRMGIEMPITAEVFRVLFENKDPRTAVNDLMLRSLKGEGKAT